MRNWVPWHLSRMNHFKLGFNYGVVLGYTHFPWGYLRRNFNTFFWKKGFLTQYQYYVQTRCQARSFSCFISLQIPWWSHFHSSSDVKLPSRGIQYITNFQHLLSPYKIHSLKKQIVQLCKLFLKLYVHVKNISKKSIPLMCSLYSYTPCIS